MAKIKIYYSTIKEIFSKTSFQKQFVKSSWQYSLNLISFKKYHQCIQSNWQIKETLKRAREKLKHYIEDGLQLRYQKPVCTYALGGRLDFCVECSQIPAEYVTPGRIKYHTWVSLFLEMVKKSMSAIANIEINGKLHGTQRCVKTLVAFRNSRSRWK